MALTKVSGGILDPGISVAGIVTATGFDGPFIGGSSKNIVAGIITATELDISGDIDVDGHTELDQLNVSGVSTFVGNIGGTPTFTGDVTFNGNVSIAQTLTYADVTNIDSVGIVTAREGVRVPYDGTNSTKYISVGASDDLKIYHHAASFSFIENNTGILHIRSVDGIKLQDQNGSEMFVNCVDNGAVELYHDNVKKLETTNVGAKVTHSGAPTRIVVGSTDASGAWLVLDGDSNGDGAGSDYAYIEHNASGHLNLINPVGAVTLKGGGVNSVVCQEDAEVVLYHNGNRKFETQTTGAKVTGDFVISDTNPRLTFTDTDHNPDYHIQVDGGNFEIKDSTNNIIKFQIDSNGHILIPRDDTYLKIGTGSDIQIYHTSNASYIQNGTGPLNIKSIAQDQDIVIQGNDGGSNISMLYFDTSEAGNAEFSGDIKLTDGKKLNLGYSNDLSLGHVFINNSHNGVINNATNVLFIESDSIVFRDKSGEGAETLAQFVKDGSCSLYNNNQKKLETKGYGIDITGGFITTGGSIVQDGGNIKFGTGSDLQIFHDNSNNINVIQCHNGRTLHIDKDNGAENMAKFIPDGGVQLYHNNNLRIETINSGLDVYGPTAAGVYLKSQGGTDYAYLYASATGVYVAHGTSENILHGVANGRTDLFYDNSVKISTSTTGITVTGEVAATQDYPTTRPTLDFNFAAEKKLDPRITFYRTTIGSYIDENGDYRWASANEPKFNHDEVTHESKGLLIEPARTNKLTSGNNIPSGGNSGGTPGPSLVANNVEAPDGSPTARTIDYSNASSNMNSANIEFSWDNSPAGKTYSASIWVKGTQGHTINMYLDASGQGSGNLNEAKITRTLTGKWQRMSVYYTYPSGANAAFLRVGTRSLHGLSQGTATVVSFWGTTVVEESQPGSTIATPIVSVTTSPDYALIDGEDFTEFFNQVEGTIITSTDTLDPAGVRRPAVIEGDVTNTDRHYIQEAGAYQYQIRDGGVTQAQIDAGSINTTKNIIAAAYKLNDAAVSFNGSDAATDTSATMPTCTKLKLGEWSGTFYFGHISRFMYYRNRIPNSQLKTLSSQ